jgi:hypothetical protein
MKKIYIVIFFAFVVLLSNYTWAANYSNPIEGIFKGNYGDTIVIEVTAEVSKNEDVPKSQKGDLAFHVKADTIYKNFHRLSEFQLGDHLKIAYKESNVGEGGKVATIITKL